MESLEAATAPLYIVSACIVRDCTVDIIADWDLSGTQSTVSLNNGKQENFISSAIDWISN